MGGGAGTEEEEETAVSCKAKKNCVEKIDLSSRRRRRSSPGA